MELKMGDFMYAENGKKFNELKIGPYEVLDKLSNTKYGIDTENK